MGSVSNIAMQRAGYVELGKFSATVSNKSHENRLKQWQATGMKIREFKDRLGQVPDFLNPFSNVGIGLSLLDFKGVAEEESVTGALAGGEILYNIFSSEENRNFLFLSVGSELKSWHINGRSNLGVTFPLAAESLLSSHAPPYGSLCSAAYHPDQIISRSPDRLFLFFELKK